MDKDLLNDFIFNTKISATIKYDGTNVGVDEYGMIYGRNKQIKPKTKQYLKTSL